MQGKLPVTIFTGFLEAGKTTLLSNLILSESDSRFAVVINEFGAVSVDDILVHGSLPHNDYSSRIFKLGGGLIAYEGEDFLNTMLEIVSHKALFDHVLIETSGLAVPTAVIEALQHEKLVDHFALDATLALLDTPLFIKDGCSSEAVLDVFRSQILASDVVVLNKIDGLEHGALELAEEKVRSLAPQVRFIEAAWQARLDSRLCLGLHLNEFRALEHIPGVTNLSSVHDHLVANVDGHSHTGLAAHNHGVNTHEHLHEQDPGWMSFCLASNEAQDLKQLEDALTVIAREQPLLRVKGFVRSRNLPELLVQGVRDKIVITEKERELEMAHSHVHSHGHSHSHDHLNDDKRDSVDGSELVFIGYEIDRETTLNLLRVQTKSNWF